MIFYLGDITNNKVPEKIRVNNNKLKLWKYGYNKEYDVIIISKDGTLGEIYYVSGIYIGFPEKPKNREDIINWNKTKDNQKWKREAPPKGLNESTQYDAKYEDYILEEIRRRNEGVWIYLNGNEVYMPGTSYFFYQWNRLDEGYPNFRVIQNELMIYWAACVADQRCYGINYVKNRRFGWSSICNSELIDSGTTNEDKELGIISKTGKDAKKMFTKLVRTFKKLPAFFMPVWDGTTTPKTELIFAEPSRKKRKEDDISEMEEGLDTVIAWHNTVINAMDGDKVFRSAIDESAKYPKDCRFNEYWSIVKTSHRQGIRIVGKAMVGSTVNAMSKGGAEYKQVYDQSDPLDRNKNDQTISGLYRLFIDTVYCWEGYFDAYGFSIVEDPEMPVLTDLGTYTSIGAITHWNNEVEALKDNPEEYNEFLRQNPRNEKHAFRDEATDCDFNLVKLLEQMEHNEYELNYTSKKGAEGSDEIERGNFTWKDGIQDTEVIWRPDKNGRFWIKKGCHPPIEYRNIKEKKFYNGVLAFAPMAEHIGCFGVDPYNRSKGADGRGSLGAIHLQTKYNTSDLPNDEYILEYLDRPATVELFFEDVLMAMVYFSIPMLAELSNEAFLKMIKNRGYRHFSLNNPFKLFKDLSHTEKELGGAPPQDTKIGDQQFFAIETYVEDHVGVSTDNRKRPIGTMGSMVFNRTLDQWKDVDLTNRTKYDAYISSSLAALGNQRRVIKIADKPKRRINPFTQYNNKGTISKAI